MPSTVFPWITNLPDDITEDTFQEDLTGLPADDYDHPFAHNNIAIRLNPIYSITDQRFSGGAKPDSDGTVGNGTDNYAAIQAALDKASSVGGGTVEIPPTPANKFFRIGSGVSKTSFLLFPSNVTLKGFGWDSKLYFDWKDSNPSSPNYDGPGAYIDNEHVSSGGSTVDVNITIRDLQIKGGALTDLAPAPTSPDRGHVGGLGFANCSGVRVTGVKFYRVPDTVVVLFGVQETELDHCFFYKVGRGAIQSGDSLIGNRNVSIHHNIIYITSDDAIAFPEASSLSVPQNLNISVNHNIIYKHEPGDVNDTGSGIGLGGKNISIVGNIIHNVPDNGILCGGVGQPYVSSGVIADNIIRNVGISASGLNLKYGIYLYGGAFVVKGNSLDTILMDGIYADSNGSVNISDNTINSAGGTDSTRYGIVVTSNSLAQVKGNQVISSAGGGIKSLSNGDCIIESNQIFNCGDSTTGASDENAIGIHSEGGTIKIRGNSIVDSRGGSAKMNWAVITHAETFLEMLDNDFEGMLKTVPWSVKSGGSVPSKLKMRGNKGLRGGYDGTWDPTDFGAGTSTISLYDVANGKREYGMIASSADCILNLPDPTLCHHPIMFIAKDITHNCTVNVSSTDRIVKNAGVVSTFNIGTVFHRAILESNGTDWLMTFEP